MDYSRIRVKMEKELHDELYSLIDGDILDYIMEEGKIESQKDVTKMVHQGQTLAISERLTPDLFALCNSVKETLHFSDAIDFYIVNSPEINAYAITRESSNKSHTIAINSGLIERFNNDELRFIIGHEIGHLISGTIKLESIIDFVFPEEKEAPVAFANKFALWRNLSELTADRYGFIASPNLDAVASGFFKMASGLSMEAFSFSPAAYLEEIGTTLAYFKESPYSILGSHPINPVRIKAIQAFSESQLYQDLLTTPNTLPDDEELHTETEELISVLLSLFDSEFELHVANFVAASGILIAGADNKISNDEIDEIVDSLSRYTIFPKKFLDAIAENEDVVALLKTSADAILADAPEFYVTMIRYLMAIVLADNHCTEDEISMVIGISEKYFKISKRETVRIIGDVIREEYVPRMYA